MVVNETQTPNIVLLDKQKKPWALEWVIVMIHRVRFGCNRVGVDVDFSNESSALYKSGTSRSRVMGSRPIALMYNAARRGILASLRK